MRTAEEYGAEALHARHLDAPYRPGRPLARSWLRVPLRRSGLVVVGGWTPADPQRPDRVGALLLGVPDPGADAGLRYVGRVGLGAGRSSGRSPRSWPGCAGPGSPFVAPLPASRRPRRAVGRRPGLVGRVEFTDWTADGRLRLPGVAGPGRPARPPADADRCCAPASPSPDARPRRPGHPAPGAARRRGAGRRSAAPPEPAAASGGAGRPRQPAGRRRSRVRRAPTAPAEARRLEQHFVYNALNTIAALMRTDPGRARELLLGFADLNRAADRPGRHARHARRRARPRCGRYLQLEQARFGPRLQVEMVVDEGLHALPMAPRRVLDAVRAVVQQRIEPRPGGGTVTVTAERAGAGCVVRVAERDGDGRDGEPTVVADGLTGAEPLGVALPRAARVVDSFSVDPRATTRRKHGLGMLRAMLGLPDGDPRLPVRPRRRPHRHGQRARRGVEADVRRLPARPRRAHGHASSCRSTSRPTTAPTSTASRGWTAPAASCASRGITLPEGEPGRPAGRRDGPRARHPQERPRPREDPHASASTSTRARCATCTPCATPG